MTDKEARIKILKTFYQRPLRFSHNFGNRELQLERDAETVKYGMELFPGMREEEIFEIARTPLPKLFMIISPEGGAIYAKHPIEGMVLCETHLKELRYDSEPSHKELEGDAAIFGSCGMCGVPDSPGRTCGSPDCKAPLHPNWPAVYCSNKCALDDA